jgi:hypothetical protein
MNKTDFSLDELFLSDCFLRGATSRDVVTMKLGAHDEPAQPEPPAQDAH